MFGTSRGPSHGAGFCCFGGVAHSGLFEARVTARGFCCIGGVASLGLLGARVAARGSGVSEASHVQGFLGPLSRRRGAVDGKNLACFCELGPLGVSQILAPSSTPGI